METNSYLLFADTSHHIYFRIMGYVTTITMHIANVVIMFSSFHGEPMKNAYVRHFSEMQCFFFTCWSFTFQTVYAAVALYSDILELKNANNKSFQLSKHLVDCRDALFTILVWPSTVFTFTMFWPFFFYDRNFFFPPDVDLVITNASNHIMHTCIFLAALWEVMFRMRPEPKTHWWHLLCILGVEAVYLSVVFAVHAIKGVWIYPIFDPLFQAGSVYRLDNLTLFCVFVAAWLAVVYYLHWGLNYVVWGSRDFLKKVY